MKGLRQAFGLNKKNGGNNEDGTARAGSLEGSEGAVGASTATAAGASKRDSLPGSPASSEKDLKKKSKIERDKKDKKHSKKGSGSSSSTPSATSPAVPRVLPWDPALPTPAATIVGAETISEHAIRFVNFCCDYFLKYGTPDRTLAISLAFFFSVEDPFGSGSSFAFPDDRPALIGYSDG